MCHVVWVALGFVTRCLTCVGKLKMVVEVKAYKAEGSDDLFDDLDAAEIFERDSRVMEHLLDHEDTAKAGFVSIQVVVDNLESLISLLFGPDGSTIYRRST